MAWSTDRVIGLTRRLAACFTDARHPAFVEHEVQTLVMQRVVGIALGYEDLIDHDELRHDPVMATHDPVLAVDGGTPVRADPLASVRALLPPDLKVVGFLGTGDDLDISFWRPYGTRHVEPILLSDSLEFIRVRKLRYAVISSLQFELEGVAFEEWLTRTHAEVVASDTVTVRVSTGPQKWFIVRFKE